MSRVNAVGYVVSEELVDQLPTMFWMSDSQARRESEKKLESMAPRDLCR